MNRFKAGSLVAGKRVIGIEEPNVLSMIFSSTGGKLNGEVHLPCRERSGVASLIHTAKERGADVHSK